MQTNSAKAILRANILQQLALTQADRLAMYDLYRRYYSGTHPDLFLQDLANKDYVLLLQDDQAQIQGFTTLAIMEIAGSQPVRAIFSGDTIIDHDFWGQQKLAFNWLRFAGEIKARSIDVPLYWFLIVKGHRTYRYLSAFSRSYYPHYVFPTPKPIAEVMKQLASKRFGEYFDASTGVIRFPRSRGHLQQDWAYIPEEDLVKPEVQFFLQRNPNYAQGEELVCLTELRPENLKPLAQRIFLQGMRYS